MIRGRRTAAGAVALGVAALPLLPATPAHAAAPRASAGLSAASVVPCLTGTNLTSEREVPKYRRYADTAPVTGEDLAALPGQTSARSFVAREAERALPSRVTIPVYVHVIKGTHRGERSPSGPKRVRHLINVLNSGYAGGESSANTATRFRFVLKHIGYTKRDGWYHAYLNGPRDLRMKRALHRGDAHTLNLYITGHNAANALGWSRFPWQQKATPRLDGVTASVDGLPGGRARGYNLGDTVVHETGHWMGLLHTFQGESCSGSGDLVADTPTEAEPSYYCQTTRDTCSSPGRDPVHNFMDYSYDSCMYMFTPGQVARMDASFQRWRQ